MAGELTVSERILYHLSAYVKFEDKYESPFDVTQDGISQACSISRAHAAIELKKLRAASIVEERLSHVRRGKSRRKVYFLTMSGKSKASHVVQYVKECGITTMVDASRVSPERSSSRTRSTKRSSPVPVVGAFFGRQKDLEAARNALAQPTLKVLSVKGIAGIGKTTLVAKLVSEFSGQRVFWYTVRSWDGTKSFADALGRFFYDNGGRKLSSYLSSGKLELGELSFLLNEELGENGYTFVFDDVDSSNVLQEFLGMMKHSSGSAKIIVTSEAQPRFYESSEVVAKREVAEIELDGLDKQASLELLKARGLSGSVAEELFETTKGHPLSLEMVTASSPAEARTQVSRFFEEKFYAQLSETEKSLLQYASVFQSPFSSEALPRELKHARKGSMLREVAPGRFELHASLRGFIYTSMTPEERRRWHSLAADHYLRSGELRDRLLHLVRSGRMLEAEMLVARSGDGLLDGGDPEALWKMLKDFEPMKDKYRQSAALTKARAADAVGSHDVAWAILEGIARDGNASPAAEALIEMGRIKSRVGELEAASQLFSQSMERCPDQPLISAKALRGLGIVESKMGNFDRAQELLERSARDAMTGMDSKSMLLAHQELGNMFICRGEYQKAIDHFSKCAAGFGPSQMAVVYLNMGIACASLGRDQDARIDLENAVRLADDTGQPRHKAHALIALAELQVLAGKLELAKEHCFRALEIVTDLGDQAGISAAYANLGLAEKACGNLEDSQEYFEESIAALESKDSLALGTRKMELGIVLKERGKLSMAEAVLSESGKHLRDAHADEMASRVETELRSLH